MTSSKLLLILTDNYNTYFLNVSLPNMCWLVLDLNNWKKNTSIYSDYSYVIS